MAIVSFKDRRLAAIFDDKQPGKGFPTTLIGPVRRKLDFMDAVGELAELRFPAGNRLEALRGDRAGQHSIRVNDQFRICFVWTELGPADVEFVDYH